MENKVCPMLITSGDPEIDKMCGEDLCAWWVPTCDGGCCAIRLMAEKQDV